MHTDNLREIPLFARFNDEQLAFLEANSRVFECAADAPIFPAGTSDAFFVLISGEWRIARDVVGSLRPIDQFTSQPGAWVGGIALLDTLAPVGAWAVQPSRILRIPIDTMHSMLAQGFPLLGALLDGLKLGLEQIAGRVRSAQALQELQTVPLFADFSDRQLSWLAERVEIVEYEAGAPIISEDDLPDACLVLLNGEWQISWRLPGSPDPLIMTSNVVGSWHGGTTLDDIAPTQVRALQVCRLARIPVTVLRKMLKNGYPIHRQLLAGLRQSVAMLEAGL
jgi:CRP-like cAMP-binding protein